MRPHLATLATLAALLAFAAQAPAADLERAGKIVSGRCFLCHGMNGESSSEVFPRLATQNASYLAKQLRDFKAGRRTGTTMNTMVAELTEAEMSDLGAYFAAQKAEPHAVSDADLAAPAWRPARAATGPPRTARRACLAWRASRRSTSRTSSGTSTSAPAPTTTR